MERSTKETSVSMTLDLDGEGNARLDLTMAHPKDGGADLAFLEHMLVTLTRYAGWELSVTARGDLPHHLKEDIALTLGQALRAALGPSGAGITRLGSAIVPMDESMVRVVADLVERPFFSGEVPDTIYTHFLRSFALEARMTLHVDVIKKGNRHHSVEAALKGLGIALEQACRPKDRDMSTKGDVALLSESVRVTQDDQSSTGPSGQE